MSKATTMSTPLAVTLVSLFVSLGCARAMMNNARTSQRSEARNPPARVPIVRGLDHVVLDAGPESVLRAEERAQLDLRCARQEAGRIMVRLVLGGWLRFEVIGCRHSNPKKYQLK